ncbi:hypothetical protein J6590_042383 [Homalodisca vitripennis]|nr:hypothetical protein J6590_042383 [Homalodisca vitripennis]
MSGSANSPPGDIESQKLEMETQLVVASIISVEIENTNVNHDFAENITVQSDHNTANIGQQKRKFSDGDNFINPTEQNPRPNTSSLDSNHKCKKTPLYIEAIDSMVNFIPDFPEMNKKKFRSTDWEIPPQLANISIQINDKILTKKDNSPEVFQQIVNQMINLTYRDRIKIFTDGSKTGEGTGAAILIPQMNPSARASVVLPRTDVKERKTSLEIVPISKISNSRRADQKYKLNCNGKAIMYV